MKKILPLILAAALMLSLVACDGNQGNANSTVDTPPAETEHTHTEEVIPAVDPTCTEDGLTEGVQCSECGEILVPQETVPALGHTTDSGTCERCGQSFGIWETYYYVDNFNQPTDQWYIGNSTNFVGTFSNSATTDSMLFVDMIVDFESDVAIFLYEYGTNAVKNSSDSYVDEYNIIMRTESGTDYNMTGTMYCGDDRIYIDDDYRNDVITALQGEEFLSFYIEMADRTVQNYLFTVIPSNFSEEYSAIAGQKF